MSNLMMKPEVAKALGTSVNTLNHWIATGYAPRSAKIGRRRVWREDEVSAWLDAQFASTAS